MKKPNTPKQGTQRITDPLHLAPHRAVLRRLDLSVDHAVDQQSQIADALASLRATYIKLTDVPDIDIKAMTDGERARWASVADELFRNIRKLETAELQSLNQQFQARSSELASATASMQTSLESLNNITDVVKAVASGLSLITNIVALLA